MVHKLFYRRVNFAVANNAAEQSFPKEMRLNFFWFPFYTFSHPNSLIVNEKKATRKNAKQQHTKKHEWNKKGKINFEKCMQHDAKWSNCMKFDLQMNLHVVVLLLFILLIVGNSGTKIHSLRITCISLKSKWNWKCVREGKKSSKQNTNRIYFWFIWINNYNGIYWHKSNEWEMADEAATKRWCYFQYM